MIAMNDKYKIIAKYIKDMSSETPDIDTYLFVKDNLSNYSLNINIQSKALKEKIIQVETTLNYSDKNENNKKSFFSFSLFLISFEIFPKINFLVIGNIIRNPTISVANPGIIKRSAPNAIAAPEIIS